MEIVSEIRQLLKGCGFHLAKFVSNREESLATVPEKDRSKSKVEVNIDTPREEKALGVAWDPDADEFRFQVSLSKKAATRKGILSTISQCYDQPGII